MARNIDCCTTRRGKAGRNYSCRESGGPDQQDIPGDYARAYQIFEGNGRRFGHDLDDWFKAEMDLLHPVHVNIASREKTLKSRPKCLALTRRKSRSASSRAG